jgi:hypothetical protein
MPSQMITLPFREELDPGFVRKLLIAALVRACLLVRLPSTGRAAI